MKRSRLWALLSFGLIVAGCASIPPVIRHPPLDDPQLTEVRRDPEAYAGRPVRWGGSIVSVNNEKSGAWIEVVDHALNRYGMPENLDRSPGRFMIRTAQSLDPAIYAPGRLITVAGTLMGGREGSIGAYIYHFPVVRPINLHLWSREAVHGRHRPRYHLGVHYGHGHFHRRGFHRHGYYSRFHRRY